MSGATIATDYPNIDCPVAVAKTSGTKGGWFLSCYFNCRSGLIRAFRVNEVALPGVRRICVLAIGALILSCAAKREPEPSAASKDARIENVVLISLDPLRADHLGLYGYERATTPNLDRFAADAVVFERAIAQAS